MRKNRFVFLSTVFYNAYPQHLYPEIERKNDRPYVMVCVQIDKVQFGIPLRSNINHTHVLWTDKKNKCGLDFSKAVVLNQRSYIDGSKKPQIRQNEFNVLKGKEKVIEDKMRRYIAKYKNAKLSGKMNNLTKYSTLQYFEEEIGLITIKSNNDEQAG